jgi:nitroreductase
MLKSGEIHYPVIDVIRNRKSTRAFLATPIETAKLNSLFEATRWAPSSTNEQPWVFLYGVKDESPVWNKMYDLLNEGNKIWAQTAPLFILSLARKNLTRYGMRNAHALYDLGAANAFLSLQAVELGLQVRQMAGFNAEKAITEFNIPDEYELGVIMAVGYPGDPEILPDNLKRRESAPRERFLQDVFVMNQSF